MMKTSIVGIKMIESFEGLRLSTYYDSVGIPTIGFGSSFLNYTTGAKVYPGLVITQAQAEQMLIDDLSATESYINTVIKVTINQKMFDALASLTYNIGQGNLSKSSVLRLLNLGDSTSAADAFLLWNRAGGIIRPGLMKRRQTERALFLAGITDLQTPPADPTVDPVDVVAAAPDATPDTPSDATGSTADSTS